MQYRMLCLLSGLLLLLGGAVSTGAAQEATPEAGLADLGLPELTVTVTGTGYEGIPEQLEAGRYLVNVTAPEDSEFGGGVSFLQPSGMTAEEFLAAASAPPEEGAAMATPAEGGDAEMEMGGPPAFYFESTFAGGVYAEGGQTASMVLDLGPGEWIAWADDPEAPVEPVIFEVTGEMPADLPEPESTATLSMSEYAINVTEGALVSGTQVVEVENVGAQPHFIIMFKGPAGLTDEQVQIALDEEMAAEMSGTPVAYSDFNPDEDLIPVAFTGSQSSGTTVWTTMTLPEPGTYGVACFFPDEKEGLPHAYLGMYAVIEVTE